MDWIIRNGTLMFIVSIASSIWIMKALSGTSFDLLISCGLSYLVWTIQCMYYVISNILKLD